jgi:ATP-binding cassette subfamily B protein
LGRYRKLLREYNELQESLVGGRSRANVLLEGAATCLLYTAYGFAALAAAIGRITIGKMTLYLQLFRQGQVAIATVLSNVNQIYLHYLRLTAYFAFLDRPSESPPGGARSGPVPSDGLRLEDVHFTYPGSDKTVIEGVSLHVRAGQSLALVGDNGAGKTTLLKLIMRLYRPTAGRITLDGLDLQNWDEVALRARMTALFQDYIRYSLIAGENIGLGDIEALNDEKRWQEAAKEGMADEVIQGLSQQYATPLGSWLSGPELSGGQWQKIALARAWMRKNADIVVLDEPTSAVDVMTESRFMERFRTMMRGRTSILISHKLSTVRLADQIAVLQNGRVVERGNHESLMTAAGQYAQMYNLQADGFR